MTKPMLKAYNRPVRTPFDLIGNDENALTFALGYLFQNCAHLLRCFLKDIGIKGFRLASLSHVQIRMQEQGSRTENGGITDLEILLPGEFHVIVEAKIGFGLPSEEQCMKYIPRFDPSTEPKRALVSLVQSGDETYVDQYCENSELKDLLVGYNWCHFLTHCVRLMRELSEAKETWQLLQWFYTFLDQSFQMKAFTTEIWIVPVQTTPLWDGGASFHDIHVNKRVYFHHRNRNARPLYIGLRANGQVAELFPVTKIENGIAVIKYVRSLTHLKEKWPYSETTHTIWHLGDPVALPKVLPTGGRLWQRHVHCDFGTLLKANSIMEIEDLKRESQR